MSQADLSPDPTPATWSEHAQTLRAAASARRAPTGQVIAPLVLCPLALGLATAGLVSLPGVTPGGGDVLAVTLFAVAATALTILACLAQPNRLAAAGASRWGGQALFALPCLLLALASAVTVAGSTSGRELALAQGAAPWMFLAVRSPFLLGSFVLFLLAASMLSARRPFDAPLAGSLGGGALTDQPPILRGMTTSARTLGHWLLLAVAAMLFLGGGSPVFPELPTRTAGPDGLRAFLWLSFKTAVLAAVLQLFFAGLPRISSERMVRATARWLFPCALVSWVGAVAWRLAFPEHVWFFRVG